jgi:hypothetical protein
MGGVQAAGWPQKMQRERLFPFEVIEKAYQIDIYDAQSSRKEDRANILSCIAADKTRRESPKRASKEGFKEVSRPEDTLLGVPEKTHPAFQEVNGKLRSLLGGLSFRHAIRHGKTADAVKAITSDNQQDVLKLDLPKIMCDGVKPQTDLNFLKGIFKNLPELNTFVLNARDCDHISDFSALKDICELQDLSEIELIFEACDKMADISWLEPWETGLSKLDSLHLYFGSTWKLENFEPLRIVGKFTTLTQLDLVFAGISDIDFIGEFANLTQLCQLKIHIMNDGINDLTNFDQLGKLGKLKNLQNFNLYFNHIGQNRSLDPLKPILGLEGLVTLRLFLGHCGRIENVECFKSLESTELKELELTILASARLSSIKPLAIIRKLKKLERLLIMLNDNKLLADVEPLACVSRFENLRELDIKICRSEVLKSLTCLRYFRHLKNLEHASLDFHGCESLPKGLAEHFGSVATFTDALRRAEFNSGL